MMTAWERIKTALEHQEPDRVPIGYYATPEVHAALKKHLELGDDEALFRRLGMDYRRVGPKYVGPPQKGGDFFLARTLQVLDATKGKIDMVLTGGDIGTQRGMMLSPQLWRERIKPWSGRLIQTYKKLGYKTIYHSDGSFLEVIEDFIELGLDVLNPVQTRAAGMDPVFLKRRFGDRLCFNGGVDIQEILPRGTPAEVAAETRRMIDILGAGGGYIVESAHAFQPDTPCQNIMAMYDTARVHHYVGEARTV